MNPLYAMFRPGEDRIAAEVAFRQRYGYPPAKCISGTVILRLGPIYPTRLVARAEVRAGDSLLVAGVWVRAEDIDGAECLTSGGDVITLSDIVTVREGA